MGSNAVIVSLLLPMMQLSGSQQLVGRWDSVERSRGGLGSWIELSTDGTCATTIGAMVDGTWKLEGEHLTLDIPLGDCKSELQMATVSSAGDTQIQVRGKETFRLTRIDKGGGDAPLVGVWKYPHSAGGEAFEEYTRDGRHLFRLPFTTTACTWTVKDSSLLVTQKGQTHESLWQLEGEVLTARIGGQLSRFRRERAGILPRSRDR